MARFSLLMLFLGASGAYAQVQGGEQNLMTWEICVRVEVTTVLEIRDGYGNKPRDDRYPYQEAFPVAITPGSTPGNACHWEGDLGAGTASGDWVFDWANHDAKFLVLDFKVGSTPLKTYTYIPNNLEFAGGDRNFYQPDGGSSSVDVEFHVVVEGGGYAVKVFEGGAYLEDRYAGDYVFPYNGRHAYDGYFLATGAHFLSNQSFKFAAEEDVVIPAGWTPTWGVEGLTLLFPPQRKLVVEGDLAVEGAALGSTLEREGVRWGGVAVYAGGSLGLDDVTVRSAEVGVDVYSDDVVITNSRLRYNGVGLRSSYEQAYCPGLQVCPIGGPSGFVLEGTEVASNSGVGVLARSAKDVVMRAFGGVSTRIHSNGGDGLYLWNAELAEFTGTHIEGNGGVGANVLDNADLRFMNIDLPTLPGLDRIANNASHELFVSAGGYLFLGKGSASGDNDIFDDQAPLGLGNRLVYNEQPCSGMLCAERVVDAEHSWWGSASGPPPGAFGGGPVDYTPYRTSPATGGSRPASPVIAETIDAAGRSDGAWLSEAIREARRSLGEAPGAEGAGGLVRRLYGLQRLDPADALGEHGPTMALLSVLRARFGQGQLPAPLRAAAEAALVAEVHDAVRLGDYAEAGGLLSGYAEAVEGPEAGRSLALARVMVAEQAGEYGEALAVLAGVMEGMEAEDPMREALAVVAEALAGQAGGAGGRPGGSALVAASRSETNLVADEVLGAPYPNPSAGPAVVPLMLSEAAEVNVAVFDVLGRQVATLAEGNIEAGMHRLALDASGLPAGVYVVRAEVGGARMFTERLTVIR